MNNNKNNVNTQIDAQQQVQTPQPEQNQTAIVDTTPTQQKKNNTLGIILLVLGIVLIAVGVGYTFIFSEENSKPAENTGGTSTNNNNDDGGIFGNIQVEIETEYSGVLMYETENKITDVFNITVPAEFVDTDEDSNRIEKKLETDGTGIFNTCSVGLSEVINFNDANLLANSMAKYYQSETTLTTKEINGISWYNFQYDLLGTNDTYITEKDGHIYILTYETAKDANRDICALHKDVIINSVSYK